ncbi:MAG: sugar phosphate isomerase/epimerase [Firmicutes bacterium]|nr:sugar phosphate isomerase/epimerase [Bacillota bacterium]
MKIKYAVITSFLGGMRNRFMEYQPHRSLEEKIELAGQIEGLDGVEVSWPADCEDVGRLKRLLDSAGLEVSAVSLKLRGGPEWFRGSLTSPDPKIRRRAVEWCKEAKLAAEALGCSLVTTCPLNDGYDYLFEQDYWKAWHWMVETLQEAVEFRPDIKLSLEYKFADPRVRCFLGTAAEALAACQAVGSDAIGVTLDVGHALQARENPAKSLSILQAHGRLFCIHTNDNDGTADWDMLPGSMNLWNQVEFFYYLRRFEFNGWLTADVIPREHDVVETFETTILAQKKLIALAERIDQEEMDAMLHERDPIKANRYLLSLLG